MCEGVEVRKKNDVGAQNEHEQVTITDQYGASHTFLVDPMVAQEIDGLRALAAGYEHTCQKIVVLLADMAGSRA
jgi:hypothetical protein